MTTILAGYAETSKAAIVFNEDDTGREVIPFETEEDAKAFAEAIIEDGYGGAYNTKPSDLVEVGCFDDDEGYRGAVTNKQATILLAGGVVNADTMFEFDDIVIR